jgi:hypothetical protein
MDVVLGVIYINEMSAQSLRLVCRHLIRYVEILVVIQISDMKDNMASVRPILRAHIGNTRNLIPIAAG